MAKQSNLAIEIESFCSFIYFIWKVSIEKKTESLRKIMPESEIQEDENNNPVLNEK